MALEKQEAAGYTDESLRMLETGEGQSNAVFACFGSAAQHAQLFEQALARFLNVYNRIASEAVWLEDFEEYEGKLQKKTMGWLLHEIQKHVTLSDPVVAERLDRSLERRNYLMHTFFLERDDGLKSEAGRMDLLAELISTERLLDDARITVNAMRIAMCETLSVQDPFANDYSGDPS
jgi:hypothetical protein